MWCKVEEEKTGLLEGFVLAGASKADLKQLRWLPLVKVCVLNGGPCSSNSKSRRETTFWLKTVQELEVGMGKKPPCIIGANCTTFLQL